MTLQQISQQVRDLILAGELDDAANALVQFFDKEWMSRGDKEQIQLYNQALYQLSQLNELKHQVFAGIISNEDADLKRNKIWAGHPTYFFKIKHDRYEGWVRQVELEFVSPECLD